MRLLSFSSFILLTACSRMAIDGQAVTVGGEPAAQARVSLIGSPCSTETDDQGRFSLTCQPGSYTLVITKQGYLEHKEEVEATENQRYDLGKKLMIAIPASEGLFLLQEARYLALDRSYLTRTIVDGDARSRTWCVDRARSTPVTVAAGAHALFDNRAPGWKAFRLDSEGCAYRDRRDASGQWEVTYRERPESKEEQIEPGRTIVLMDLQEGEYFLADWEQGFFTPDANDKQRYTGYLLQVGG